MDMVFMTVPKGSHFHFAKAGGISNAAAGDNEADIIGTAGGVATWMGESKSVVFHVQAKDYVEIAFYPTSSLGCTDNTGGCTITKPRWGVKIGGGKVVISHGSVTQTVSAGGATVSDSSFKTFWASAKEGTVKVGTGSTVNSNVMHTKHFAGSSGVKAEYVAFRTINSEGTVQVPAKCFYNKRDSAVSRNAAFFDQSPNPACQCQCRKPDVWSGVNCEICSRDCGVGKISAKGEAKGLCQCDCDTPTTGMTGPNCEVPAFDCVNGGVMDTTKDPPSCTCPKDHLNRRISQGQGCHKCVRKCDNHGRADYDLCLCRCPPQWKGASCETCALKSSADCANGGTLPAGGACKCTCPSTHRGHDCSIPVCFNGYKVGHKYEYKVVANVMDTQMMDAGPDHDNSTTAAKFQSQVRLTVTGTRDDQFYFRMQVSRNGHGHGNERTASCNCFVHA
jgi:hypothetical protein